MKEKFHHVVNLILAYLTSLERVSMVFFGFVFFAIFVIWTAFKYTVVEYDYYKGLADKQQMMSVKNPVSRGTIYSNNNPQ